MRRSRKAARPSLLPRNVYVRERRTSLRLEPVMWDALADIAAERGASIHDLVTEAAESNDMPNLSAAVRVFIVAFYRSRSLSDPR
jgi:predicted DNA-binding ribbon-helix-helix protein